MVAVLLRRHAGGVLPPTSLPEDELNLNPNYADETLPDIMDTRVWWDVENGVGPNG
jgi:hypothetical protein